MATIGEPEAALPLDLPASTAVEGVPDGAWERQFIDDLIAANRLKNFLVTQGFDVPKEVLEGLARLSDNHRYEMNAFVEAARVQLRRRSLSGLLYPWPFTRAEPL